MNSSTMKETINKAAHTPGPWKVRKRIPASNFDKVPRFAVETDDGLICETRPIKAADEAEYGYDAQQTEANARLIAAAPELLRLVEHLEQLIQPVIEYPHACDANSLLAYRLCQLEGGLKQARAAIAKARK